MDFRDHEINRSWTDEEKVELLRLMSRVRRFEQACIKLYQSGRITGWLNLSIGQESIAATARGLMGPMDHSISGTRGIGHAIAAGIPLFRCAAELMGLKSGCSKGKGGMHSFYNPGRGHWGCHAIAAAQTPLAAGLAFAIKQRGERGAAICFLGDGAVNQGVYHESLNLSALFELPVVYVIENNGFSMGTSVDRSSSFTGSLAKRAEAYGIRWDRITDQDPYEIRARLHPALERARNEHLPSVIEIETCRYHGFTLSDANHWLYQSKAFVKERNTKRDPLSLWRNHLMESGVLDETGLERLNAEIANEMLNSMISAHHGEFPTTEDLLHDVYWESDHQTPASGIGTHFFGDPR